MLNGDLELSCDKYMSDLPFINFDVLSAVNDGENVKRRMEE